MPNVPVTYLLTYPTVKRRSVNPGSKTVRVYVRLAMGSNKNVTFAAARDKAENIAAYQVKLERVLGLTVASNAALDCDPQTELVAYPAGCTVVLLDARRGRQTHLLNASRKSVSCLSFSADGRYLATGEVGHLPAVRVWDLQEPRTQLAELLGHKFGVVCVAFSPSGKHLVSVGSQHDMIVNVWDWRQGVKLASNKVSARVKAVSFAENGSYFVTVGNRHVKFWYLEHARSAKYKEAVPLMGRSAILGEQRNNHFCDVGCGRGEQGDSTYAVTRSGLLCEFNNRRLLDKWVELRTTSANCMVVGENYIFIGCAEGIVRCFSPSSLQFITTLPRTHYLGVDVAQGLTISHMGANSGNAHYPDVVALAYDSTANKLSCVYNDHSLYIWDVEDIKRVGKAHSYLHHSACIWGVETYPETGSERLLPSGSFVTCSSDDTVRVWNLDHLESATGSAYQRNIYSNELLKVLYIDPELTHLKDQTDTKVEGSYDGRNGVRSIRISPDGKHLASGDRSGNVRVHELERLAELCRIEAHDAEVLCLEFSPSGSNLRLLASASRDRLIHVFNVDQGYDFMQTLDDHSSSITAVRFLNAAHDQLQMVSCGADKSIIFRQLQANEFARGHNAAGKSTLYDMEVDHGQKHVLTACQDRNVRVYSAASGKHSKTFRGSVGDEGSLIKVVLDSSGIYAATSCTDKTLCVYDYYSSELMATMYGHSELVTGLRFTNDCRRLISASGDGCIFIWRLPRDMVVTMQARLAQQAARAGRRVPTHNGHLDNDFASLGSDLSDRNANVEDNCRLSAAELPLWATKQTERGQGDSRPAAVELPRGRWAQRIGPSAGISVKSVYDEETIIPFPHQDKRLDSDGGGSKDSSIDSGTETLRQYPDARPGTRPKYKYDGDDESFSDERDHVMYYPANDETGSDFTVNAMDVDELRRSQRRLKNKRPDRLMPEMPHITVSTSVSGSQDSEEDEEDEASTPGANEPAELSSALSVSTESLEQFRRREKYLVSAFQSLPNTEPTGKDAGGSISARHSARNSAVISAARLTRGEGEAESKRDELRKRIEHTRRQLSSVGFRSTLKNSQSICDLSRHDRTANSSHAAGRYTQAGGKLYANVIRHKLANPSLSQLCDRGYATNPMLQTYRPLSYQHSKPLATGLFAKHNRNALFENCANFYRDPNATEGSGSVSNPDDDNRNRSDGANAGDSDFYCDTNSRCAEDLFQNRLSSLDLTSPVRASYSSNNLSSNNPSALASNDNANVTETVRFSVCQVVTERISDKFYQLAKSASNTSFREDRFVDCSTENKHFDGDSAKTAGNHFKLAKATEGVSVFRKDAQTGEVKRSSAAAAENEVACRPGFLNLSAKKRNQSLPQSPVTEEASLLSPTSGNQTDNESSAFRRRFGGSLRSCSYFLDLNKLCDKKPGHYTSAKSSEYLPTSLPASLPTSLPASQAVSRDDLDDDHFSSDSLEEPSEFSNRTPKRSIPNQDSRFQQFCKASQEFQSQESIISNTSNQLSSTGDLLDLCEQDRHSSASFFLSLRRYENRSQESILSNDFLDNKSIPSQHRSSEDILDREFEMGISESRSSEDILNERFMKKSTSLPRGYFLPETSSLPRRAKIMDQSIDSLDSIEHRPIVRTTSLQDAKKLSDPVAKPKANALSRKGSCPVGRPRQTPLQENPVAMARSLSFHGSKPPIAAKPQGRVTHKPPVKPVKPRRKSLVGGTQVGRVARLREAFSCPEGGKTDSDEDVKKVPAIKAPGSADGKGAGLDGQDTSGHPEMVKLLCRSFERALEREMSDSDGFRTAGSNSSTPLTSSSGANSPKRDARRLWPPASRAVMTTRRGDHGNHAIR